jgi:transcription antitermination protein NusB
VATGRRSARREALFLLYQSDLIGVGAADAIARSERIGVVVDPYTSYLVLGVEADKESLDAVIGRHLQGWTVERLAALERNILRLGVFELTRHSDASRDPDWVPAEVPAEVAIDQAVVLAKRFCSDEAGALVNGVLGAVLKTQGA